jgi:hypothetical protein
LLGPQQRVWLSRTTHSNSDSKYAAHKELDSERLLLVPLLVLLSVVAVVVAARGDSPIHTNRGWQRQSPVL